MNIIGFRSLGSELDEDQPFYGLQPKGLNPNDKPLEDIELIASGYVEEIIQSNPTGPYSLIGYSSGGLLALEMSVQIEKLGKKISFLGLLDSYVEPDMFKLLYEQKKYVELLGFTIRSIYYGINYFVKSPRMYLKLIRNYIYSKLENKKYNSMIPNDNDPLYVIHNLKQAHERAFAKYSFKKYTTPVHLFKSRTISSQYMRYADTNGLEPLIDGKIKVIKIPFDHLQFFEEPYVKTFAAELKKALYLAMITLHVVPV